MENEREMLLLENNFTFSGEVWEKENWTIRFYEDEFECFDDEYYFKGDVSILEKVLEDIK